MGAFHDGDGARNTATVVAAQGSRVMFGPMVHGCGRFVPLWRSRPSRVGDHGGLDARLGATSFESTDESAPVLSRSRRGSGPGSDEGVTIPPGGARAAAVAKTWRQWSSGPGSGQNGPQPQWDPLAIVFRVLRVCDASSGGLPIGLGMHRRPLTGSSHRSE